MRLLRAAERMPAPWKNGSGITREIATFPAGASLHDFEWRVSIADVAAPGAFSSFPNVDRILTVLEGRLQLREADADPVILEAGDPPYAFDGNAKMDGEPIGQRVRDLNVMTRRGRWRAIVERCAAGESLLPSEEAASSLLVATGAAMLTQNRNVIAMEALDAVLFEGGATDASLVDGIFYRIDLIRLIA